MLDCLTRRREIFFFQGVHAPKKFFHLSEGILNCCSLGHQFLNASHNDAITTVCVILTTTANTSPML